MTINNNQEPDKKETNPKDMPMGFGFMLAANKDAMQNFATMDDAEKRQVIEAARNVQSKGEMESFVDSIGKING